MSTTQGKISYFIYSLDFLSGAKSFKMFDREKNVSLVGLIFTIILASMIILYSAVELINYFQQTNYSFISMEDNSEKIDATKFIGKNGTIAALRFIKYDLDEDGNEIEVPIPDLLKIFKIRVRQYNYDYATDDSQFDYYNMENCTKYFDEEELIKYNIPSHYIENAVCPPYDKGLRLRWSNYALSTLAFQVFLCNKSENENCYSKEEIIEKYESGYLDYITFGFIQEFNIVDNNNHTNPLTTESLMTENDLDLGSQYIGDSRSKFIHYSSDDGIIFNNIKNYTGLRFDTYTDNVKDRDDAFDFKSSIVAISYSINMNNILNYKRTYVKLTTVIVDIAGIARVLFFVGGFSISFLSQNYFSYKLFEEIFSQKYLTKNQNEVNNNAKIHEDISSQISSNKNNKINIYNSPEDSGKIGSENIFLKVKAKKRKVKKGKTKKNNMTNTNIILNDVNIDNTNDKSTNKENGAIKKNDNEKYSMILSRYLGYDVKDKKKFTFWNFICSQFNKGNNNMKIINSCARMINNYLSLEQMINNGINIDILLSNYESQEMSNIDKLNKVIDDDFKKTIKNIKDKKE